MTSMQPTGVFLDLVLASEGNGLRCATFIKDGHARNTHFDTNAGLEGYLLKQAGNADVYHACATFQQRGTRKKENAAFYRSVWADVDIKPFEVALTAIRKFVDDSSMPLPSYIVASGGMLGGLHAYWVFTRDVTVDEWEPVAFDLCRLCELHKLAIDASAPRMPSAYSARLER